MNYAWLTERLRRYVSNSYAGLTEQAAKIQGGLESMFAFEGLVPAYAGLPGGLAYMANSHSDKPLHPAVNGNRTKSEKAKTKKEIPGTPTRSNRGRWFRASRINR